jgi:hypothetical protein
MVPEYVWPFAYVPPGAMHEAPGDEPVRAYWPLLHVRTEKADPMGNLRRRGFASKMLLLHSPTSRCCSRRRTRLPLLFALRRPTDRCWKALPGARADQEHILLQWRHILPYTTLPWSEFARQDRSYFLISMMRRSSSVRSFVSSRYKIWA